MKKIALYPLLLSFLSIVSCSDSSTSYNTQESLRGTWKIEKRTLETNYPRDIDLLANKSFIENNDTLKIEETYNIDGSIVTTGLQNGTRIKLREDKYKFEGDTVLSIRNVLTAIERLRGPVSITGQSMVARYRIDKYNLGQILLDLKIDNNLVPNDIVGVLTVRSSR